MTRFVCFSLLVLLLTGCGGEGHPSTVPVTGLVTFDGAPISDATVTFYPAEGRPASGRTNAEGVYTLTTFETGDGAVPGSHKVSISKLAASTESNTPEEMDQASKSEIPEKYANAQQSGLTATVSEGQEAVIDFNLVE